MFRAPLLGARPEAGRFRVKKKGRLPMEREAHPMGRHAKPKPTLVCRLTRLLPEKWAKHVRRWWLWWLGR